MQASRFVAAIVVAQVLAQIAAFTLPALLPFYLADWQLSATQAGWLIGAFFAAYVAAVPVLVALTDRLPARRIYLLGTALTAASHFGFAVLAEGFWSGLALRALAGIGWAGCYMPGLKALADRLEGAAQSRAVSWHAAGVGIAGALSFLVAGTLDALAGPRAAFLFGGLAALAACGIGAAVLPNARPARPPGAPPPGALLDFRPVLRNRAAMAWIAGYTVHTWELAALRAWAVTFLALVIARQGAPHWLPGPPVLFTAAGLAGIAVSILGNETAQRFGRGRVVAAAMGAAALLSLLTGFSALVSAPFAVACVLAWNAAIYLDSSALTAGTVQAAEPGLRGATMGLHSMCGYAGGFLGPLGVGLALDWAGPEALSSWGLAFGHVAVVTLLGLLVLRRLGRPA
ncbi:MFS transporter [Falsiroseomonas selenitidurans]|uniref:MFS transporter n=1 Tax=Falsiroseomonas selenitidurans TaxID=2716335 RepID=A0ABX1E9R0_9PROT|nr:MFS transporter [Falsiroseomonas selenitidurans]NKC33525.1 MFS transporter [Falsiroseomonas selenitidurans]